MKSLLRLLGMALVIICSLSYQMPVNAQSSGQSSSGTQPVFRLYCPFNADHFYTVNPDEVTSAMAAGYISEGAIGYAPRAASGTAPVYRLFYPPSGAHFYTTNPAEAAYAESLGYNEEGVAFQVLTAAANGALPLYRFYWPMAGKHFYTTSQSEYALVLSDGFVYEGIVGYLYGTAAVPPPAVTGLTAAGQWVTSCPICGNMPMAHVVLSWNAVSQADCYRVFRDGVQVQDNVTTPGYIDMSVTSGQTYAYTVCAVCAGAAGPQSASAAATAPNPPATMPASFTAPTNLRVQGVWQAGSTDLLTWDPVPGAASYNVYQYDQLLAKGVTGDAFTVPTSLFNGAMTYTVTAVDGDCACESLPSAIAGAQGAPSPAQPPGWTPPAPPVPGNVTATAEWNAGGPRIHLNWAGDSVDYTYNIYRDGQKVASGLWGLAWFDNTVKPGETHRYTVTGVNLPWTTPVESAPSAGASATVLSAAPALLPGKVQIVSVRADDDSAIVSFTPIPGAADYRVYDVTNPSSVKYAGSYGTGQSGDMIKNGFSALPAPTVLSIQMNGLNPTTGADLVVEAVDKLGPFQKMDGSPGPGSMQMNGTMSVSINGQGDPSNVPNVLARSDAFHVTCQPFALTGSQAFYDTFRNDAAFTPATPEPIVAAESNSYSEIKDIENDKWRIRTFGADTAMTKSFLMGSHFMDTLYDGPTAATAPFSHNNNASLVMMPKATADITGGKVLHVTFEVDAHFDSRRWCDVFVGEAGDPLLQASPQKLDGALPTVKGNLFVWEIMAGNYNLELIQPNPNGSGQNIITDLYQSKNWSDQMSTDREIYSQVFGVHSPYADGSAQNLDKRSRFDLYLSQSHYKVVETEPDGVTQLVRENDFPAGVTLPFSNCQTYFAHELYHTGNDRPENLGDPNSAYWVNNRPYSDERHWDDMGFEVLSGFPQ